MIGKYKKEIRQWVKLVEADVPGVNLEKTLILNVRGGEYKRNPVLLLTKKYWRNVIEYYSDKYDLKSYKVVTDDLNYAGKIFGESNVLKLDVAQCYTLLSKAHYLGLSNSSFAFFPVWLSNQSKSIIAPKYWARHNVSSGFWCRSDNLYKGWKYLDNVGQIYDYESCLEEMNNYVVDGCLDHLDESGFIFKLKTRRIFYGEYMSRLLDYICIPFRR